MACWCPRSNTVIQTLDQFAVGREVGFTDAYRATFADGKADFCDWIVIGKNQSSGTVEIQRRSMPCTKFSLGWGWVYLK